MRIVIGEDESLLRQGLVHVLEHAGHSILGTAADATALIRCVDECRPDLVINDIRRPPAHTDEGLQAALKIRASTPHRSSLATHTTHVRGRTIGRQRRRHRLPAEAAHCRHPEVSRRSGRVRSGGTILDPEVVALLVARADRDHDSIRQLTAANSRSSR